MFRMNKFSFLLGISLMMCSCNSNDFDYSEYHTINQEQFKNSDTLKYEFSSMTDNSYKLYWSIRYSDEYEFSNLWLRINDNSKIVRVEVPLFDKTGKPLGQCTGGVCTQTIFWKIQELKEKFDEQKSKFELLEEDKNKLLSNKERELENQKNKFHFLEEDKKQIVIQRDKDFLEYKKRFEKLEEDKKKEK